MHFVGEWLSIKFNMHTSNLSCLPTTSTCTGALPWQGPVSNLTLCQIALHSLPIISLLIPESLYPFGLSNSSGVSSGAVVEPPQAQHPHPYCATLRAAACQLVSVVHVACAHFRLQKATPCRRVEV